MNLRSLYLTKENITILSFLVLFTAISMILISFCFDTLVGTFSQLGEKDYLLRESLICPIIPEINSCFPMKRDLSNNDICIFDSFIDLFNKSYFPSYFQTFTSYNGNIVTNKVITSVCTDETRVDLQNLAIAKEIISYNQYLILEHHNNHLNDLLNDLCKILLEYKESNSL